MRTRAKSLRDLVPATFLKYEKLNCLIKFQSNEHASLLVNILFENNIFSLASSIDDPILVKPSYNKKGERLNEDEVFFRGFSLFCCGNYSAIFQKQMDVPYNSLNGLNHLQIIEALESRKKYRFSDFNFRIEPFTDGLKNYRSCIIKHVLDCPSCYAKLSESVDFSSFKKIAESINLFGSNSSADKGFTQSDFDRAIADLKSQITELKAKYPEFVVDKWQSCQDELSKQSLKPVANEKPMIDEKTIKFKGVYFVPASQKYASYVNHKNKKIHLGSFLTKEYAARAYDLKIVQLRGEGCTTNFAVEGIHTKVLFPDYPATKRHEAFDLSPKPVKPIKEPIQLNMVTLENEPDDNQCETIYDRMRAFAAQNGIEIKTMQT